MLIIVTTVPVLRNRVRSAVRFYGRRSDWLNGYGCVPREALFSDVRIDLCDTRDMERFVIAAVESQGFSVESVRKGDVRNLWFVTTV